ncbi:BadF/BadG/BcrA/BcrD ATPase family protein [Amphibiibacter pelophylacis]|uniref:BadF/BadG/BcrA/BcrD ATPase family protein n=1 Tax=Amphibiibacter pelophylacis TaxID=1799477 RepID=A0ACC6NYU2_9BURK
MTFPPLTTLAVARRVPLRPAHVLGGRGADPAPVRWWVGVDGGGSGTRVRVHRSDAPGVSGEGQAGPSALGQGVDQAWRHIRDAAQQAFAQIGLELDDSVWAASALAAGLSGANVPGQAEQWLAARPPLALTVLDSDAVTAVLGALGGRPGGVVAVGTGSVGVALDAQGRQHHSGGWGWRVGDEGSGAWLGMRAIQHTHQASDGRATAGALAEAVWAVTGRSVAEQLAWDARAGQTAYASLAPAVFDTAAQDPAAARLIARAADHIRHLALALDATQSCDLVLTGSVGQRLRPELERQGPDLAARFVPRLGDGCAGALILLESALAPDGGAAAY